ncbi:alpha-hydroxy-acid oxidizing protein [Chroococcidiopsis sp. FACHB-1243]|uniref:alpha-hydroxy acid oxidase n=1 Tax=Chroococcidiopsis sp. [FACHB-1243] TaxID=2692781 RepID=UPI00178731C5|nr:alpha-hydroxy acid oxidase [Chroococcidiopsis sp. [FACHB-1243]]MBD2307960.1 alpha-hydroxy-acid oxidizing protein [Chroococcidiopsis sp. [FACHB-1243]]
MMIPSTPINLFEYETLAQNRLSQMAWDYYASGAWDEVTLKENRIAFNRYRLHPRMLVDVSQRDLSTTILGQSLSAPILIAPMAFQCLADPAGEVATAKAAAHSGIGMVLSTLSTKSVSEVAIANPQTWFQLYIHRDRNLTRALVEYAYKCGAKALCVTVDAPFLGRRERDTRNQFILPPGMELANLNHLKDQNLDIPHRQGESGLFAYFAEQLDPGVTWTDLAWLRSLVPIPLVVKGILRPDDAIRAVEVGAEAIMISNHGGRQLDGAIATIDVVSQIVTAVGDRTEVLMDGGIRRGTDILKALALGAKAVLIGRPVLWGLAVAGETGVQHVIEILRDELSLAMALSGCAKLQDIDFSLVQRESGNKGAGSRE